MRPTIFAGAAENLKKPAGKQIMIICYDTAADKDLLWQT